MTDLGPPRWLEWARQIQAHSQTGLHYAANDYERQRYTRLSEIAAEMVSECGGLEYPPLAEVFKAQIGYATPRIDVRGAVFQDGRLLLVRERADNGWTMPGGWADVGDVPSVAAEREVWEEAGFQVRARRLVGVYDANRIEPLQVFHAYKLVFLCDLVGGQARPSSETSEVAFFAQEEAPKDLSPARTPPRVIQDAFAALRDPAFTAVYD